MAVGELLLSAFFQVLFDRLASSDLLKFVRQPGVVVDSELKKWESTLRLIQGVLSDAEEKQLTNEAVKFWLNDLRDLAYDAEYILDEFATKLALKSKSMAHQASTSNVQNLIPAACFNCFSGFNSSMRSKIESISTRLEELCQTRIQLGLQMHLNPGEPSAAAQSQQRQSYGTSSVPEERAVYGRDKDKANILDLLLTDGPTDQANFHLISIIGSPGVGKTKLAQEVYNDEAVENFDIKAWVCVSDDFDVFSISKLLLSKIASKPCDLVDTDKVQVELKRAVNGKRFLLVLDDVWNEDYNLWSKLKAPFISASPKSKIIVTTRSLNVASTMGAVQHYNLNPLSDEDCWSIFMMHAFEETLGVGGHPISGHFQKKVVAKCGGLPLAAKTLGGLLRSKRKDAWDELLNSNILDLPQSGILPALKLSYHYLPSHLKRCFSYCAIFPKDYQFEQKELVFLWMAEGIIHQSRKNKQLEEWGNECFQDLLSRSIFQQSSGDGSKFVMHDLVHDLAQLVSGETILRVEEANKQLKKFERVRHSSYNRGRFDGKGKFEVFNEIEHLRTFLPISGRTIDNTSYLTSMFLSELLPKFKKLRVLSLQGYKIAHLPISFKDFRSLRYLNLAGSGIRSLPESTSSLLNLLILILRDCSCLIKLPSKIINLINLRHLDIKGANLLKEMPPGMKELKCLQTLSNFIVGKGKVSSLKDLKNLNYIRGELCISRLENVEHAQDAREARLCEKQNLEALSLQYGSKFDNLRDEEAEEKVLDMLQPCLAIQKLIITCYGGKRFPSWIGNPSYSRMEVLKLENCENGTALPALGLLSSLKDLTIKGLWKLKRMGSEVYGENCSKPFQSLEILRFENLLEWEIGT